MSKPGTRSGREVLVPGTPGAEKGAPGTGRPPTTTHAHHSTGTAQHHDPGTIFSTWYVRSASQTLVPRTKSKIQCDTRLFVPANAYQGESGTNMTFRSFFLSSLVFPPSSTASSSFEGIWVGVETGILGGEGIRLMPRLDMCVIAREEGGGGRSGHTAKRGRTSTRYPRRLPSYKEVSPSTRPSRGRDIRHATGPFPSRFPGAVARGPSNKRNTILLIRRCRP